MVMRLLLPRRSSPASGRGEHVHAVRAPVGRVERGCVHEEARREALRAGDAHQLQQLELLRRQHHLLG